MRTAQPRGRASSLRNSLGRDGAGSGTTISLPNRQHAREFLAKSTRPRRRKAAALSRHRFPCRASLRFADGPTLERDLVVHVVALAAAGARHGGLPLARRRAGETAALVRTHAAATAAAVKHGQGRVE